jgi:hypothetical protein
MDSSMLKTAFKNGPMSGGTGVAASEGQLDEAEDDDAGCEGAGSSWVGMGGKSSNEQSRDAGSCSSCSKDVKYESKNDLRA